MILDEKLSNSSINRFNTRNSYCFCSYCVHGCFRYWSHFTRKSDYQYSEELQVEREDRAADIQYIYSTGGAAIVLYIIALVIAFVIKQKTKIIGIVLLVVAVATLLLIGYFGVIGFALLLTGGIVALKVQASHNAIKNTWIQRLRTENEVCLKRGVCFLQAIKVLSPSISISVCASSALFSKFRRNFKSAFDNRSEESLVISYLPTHLSACLLFRFCHGSCSNSR